MNYKSMLLIALLLPAFCYSQNNKESVKTISDAQYKKILELKEISKRIKTSSEFIRTWINEQHDDQLNLIILKETDAKFTDSGFFQVLYTSVKCGLRGKKHPILEAKDKIKIEISSLMHHLMKALHGEGTFDHDLSKELLNWDSRFVNLIFDPLKFGCLDAVNENYLLEYLVGCYQECLNELIEMSKKSANLKQEV